LAFCPTAHAHYKFTYIDAGMDTHTYIQTYTHTYRYIER